MSMLLGYTPHFEQQVSRLQTHHACLLSPSLISFTVQISVKSVTLGRLLWICSTTMTPDGHACTDVTVPSIFHSPTIGKEQLTVLSSWKKNCTLNFTWSIAGVKKHYDLKRLKFLRKEKILLREKMLEGIVTHTHTQKKTDEKSMQNFRLSFSVKMWCM